LLIENNQQTAPISIREEKLKVLVVESLPRWEYRYLRNALSRDPGIEVSCLLFHPGLSKVGGGNKDYLKAFPERLDELSKYDVVFLGDVGAEEGQLTVEQCRLLKGLVEHQASGLVFMPGLQGRQFTLLETELADLCPVQMDAIAAGRVGFANAGAFRIDGAGTTEPADEACGYAGRESGGLGEPAGVPVVCTGAAGEGGNGSAVGASERVERGGTRAVAGDADIRDGEGVVHGDGRGVALAEGGGG
jgi:hypothetical protein